MIHLERTSLLSEGGDTGQYSYQVHVIESEDKLSQLIALEQQLEVTEQRFRRLQNYVDYIRTLYHGSVQDPASVQICNLSASTSFPLDFSNAGGNVTSSDDLKHHFFLSTEDMKDMNGGGDATCIKEASKDDTAKKKKNAKKKGVVKKAKTPSKRTLQEDLSSRVIERKAKVKVERVSPPKKEMKEITVSSTYLKPTVSSQMKNARPCHPGFNFRSIPFVAGKATTRSHNLGIKIQETLSIIKRNTPAEVGRCTDQAGPELSAPLNQSVPISRMAKSECGPSRSKCSMTSRPVTYRSSTSLSDSVLLDDINDNAETSDYLKKALVYIQTDFTETLNEYKALTNQNDPEKADKVKELEEKLDRKEEVIIAFSKLYNQVISLRRQLENSHYYRHNRKYRACSLKSRITSSYPAVKLTRLLRKIQDFQNKMQGFPVL